MAKPIIEIEHLSKRYRIGAQREPYLSIRDTVVRRSEHLWNILRRKETVRHAQDDFWALKDISFSVQPGEAVGIIGRNGAGKSTLLKILSQITPPTDGSITMRGRVASLLEVGTGFHQELTGRENIFLNGTILGMTRAEIRKKFDEIVAFSEIGKFLDTPVKRYSSGMYVRLAFAVAAHLEPEILIVDEVLAVGDAGFQKKCLGKMGDVTKHGRTVLFVSHNMNAIQQLTQKCLYLESGQVQDFALTSKVVGEYLGATHREVKSAVVDLSDWQPRLGNNQAQILKLEILDVHDRPTTTLPMLGSVKFRLTCRFPKKCDASFGVFIHTSEEEPLLDLRNSDTTSTCQVYQGNVVVLATVTALSMYPGEYLVSPWIADFQCRKDLDWVQYCSRITILPPVFEDRILSLDPKWGRIYAESSWRITQ